MAVLWSMSAREEQRVNIKFLAQSGKNPTCLEGFEGCLW